MYEFAFFPYDTYKIFYTYTHADKARLDNARERIHSHTYTHTHTRRRRRARKRSNWFLLFLSVIFVCVSGQNSKKQGHDIGVAAKAVLALKYPLGIIK